MLLKENLKMAVDSILANKMRSLLTMLGIIIGIAAVIAILSVGNGAANQLTATFSDLGATTISLSASDEDGSGDLITDEDIQVIKESISEVEYVSPDETATGQIASDFDTRSAIISYGTPDMQYTNQMMNSTLVHGRYFNQTDYEDAKNVAVVTEDTARALFNGRTDVVGETVQLIGSQNQISLQVVGVLEGTFEELQGSFDLSEMPLYVAIPFPTMEELNPNLTEMDSLTIQTESTEDIEPVSNQVVRLLELRHNSIGEDNYTAYNFLQALDQVNQVLSLFINFIAAVAAIALLVGGIGVMNIMLVSVTERTREIGTRKALGATTRTILVQFLMESVILSLVGGFIGLTLGIILSNVIASALNIVPEFTLSAVVLVLVFSTAVGIFFGIYPAQKAAKLDPIEALRYE